MRLAGVWVVVMMVVVVRGVWISGWGSGCAGCGLFRWGCGGGRVVSFMPWPPWVWCWGWLRFLGDELLGHELLEGEAGGFLLGLLFG